MIRVHARPERAVFFAAGDSYPADTHIESAMRERLCSTNDQFIGHSAMQSVSGAIAHRVAALAEAVAKTTADTVILIGRSSGARVVTELGCDPKFAERKPLVIALGYPFENPARGREPARYLHLRDIPVPTMIIQGERDHYGNVAITSEYSLSPCVSVELIDADHEMKLTCEAWDDIAARVEIHIARHSRPRMLRRIISQALGLKAFENWRTSVFERFRSAFVR